MEPKLHELEQLGQSIWIDFIRRKFLETGKMANLVEKGVVGLTSNPSIFEKAIAGNDDYDLDLRTLASQGYTTMQIYENLAIEDIQKAADLLLPIYERTDYQDGYVSLEVNPELAHDTEGTIADALRLAKLVNRLNLMIKVPATPEGIPAVTQLIGQGINVNVTLIFSLHHYLATANAYIEGVKILVDNGGDLSRIASVASFFISRIDTAVDKELDKLGNYDLLGKTAIASAKQAYQTSLSIFDTPEWNALAAQGAKPQRVLWASTSTKNPAYPDTLYIDELIGKNTVNTVPPSTLDAYLDHGKVAETITNRLDQVQMHFDQLNLLGISIDAITEELQLAGVASFAKAFDALIASVETKRLSFSQ